MIVRLKDTSGTSKKFWTVEVEGCLMRTSWGRIGSAGTAKEVTHGSKAEAEAAANKLAAAKRKKGYRVDKAKPKPSAAPPRMRASGAKARQETSDLARLKAWFRTKNKGNFIALQPSKDRCTQSAGHEDVGEAADRRKLTAGEYAFVFWHDQSHDYSFNKSGDLLDPLSLHWGGPYQAVCDALEGPPDGFEIRHFGEGRAFEVWPVSSESSNPEDSRGIRIRLLALQGTSKLKSEDLLWLSTIMQEGPIDCLLQCLAVVGDRKLPTEVVAQTGDRLQADVSGAVSGISDFQAGAPLQSMFARLKRAKDKDRVASLSKACLATKNDEARAAAARALRFYPSEETQKQAAKLIRSNYLIGREALESFLIIRSKLEKESVAEIALALASDWHNIPGCGFEKSAERIDDCLRIICEHVGVTDFIGLATSAKIAKKQRRAIFELATELELNAAMISALQAAGEELRVPKKTLAALKKWQAKCVESGKLEYTD